MTEIAVTTNEKGWGARRPHVDAHVDPHVDPHVDYEALLGSEAYERLAPRVRTRMAAERASYVGVMEQVELSPAGRLLAWLAAPIGRPLATHTGRDVDVAVEVSPDADGGSQWRRLYHFATHGTVDVTSVKRLNEDGLLVECLGGWMHMVLNVREEDGALVFESNEYVLNVGPFAIKLPSWLNPGRTRVVHRDLENGHFRFELAITHPLLGRLVTQGGTFIERSDIE